MLSWSCWLSAICEPGGEGDGGAYRQVVSSFDGTSNRHLPRPAALAKSADKINDALSI